MSQFHLREWAKLPFGEGPGQIPEPLAERLVAVAKASPFARAGEGGVLEHHRHHIRARGVVGVIAVSGGSLEILPKIDLPPGADGDTAVRKRLVHMLAVALDLQLDPGAVTALSWQSDTLLDILIRTEPAPSACDRHREKGPAVSVAEHHIARRDGKPIPCRRTFIVDNVITSGNTIRACSEALGFGTGLVFGDASFHHE